MRGNGLGGIPFPLLLFTLKERIIRHSAGILLIGNLDIVEENLLCCMSRNPHYGYRRYSGQKHVGGTGTPCGM